MSDHIRIMTSPPGHAQPRWTPDTTVRDWESFKSWLMDGDADCGKTCRPYVPVTLNGPRRQNRNLVARHILTLDADHAGGDYLDRLAQALPWAALSHTTASHREENPRWRTLVPLSRAAEPWEAKTLASHLVDQIGREWFDVTASTSPIAVAYAPAWAGVVYEKHDGPVLDVDALLMVAEPVGWSPGDPTGVSTVGEFLAEHSALPEVECSYGRATVRAVVAELEATAEGTGVHPKIFSAACRFVELVLAGCWSVEDYEWLRDTALGLRARPRPHEWDEALAGALKKVCEAETACSLHGNPAQDFAEPLAPVAPLASGWEPVDLAATVAGLLDGTLTSPVPSLGDFGAGCLFYAGRINGVHGDSTAGKTWTALVTARQELAKGNTVVYVDLEDSAAGVVARLLHELAVPAEHLRERFVYVHPDDRLGPAAAAGLRAMLARLRPSLLVIDSTGEALAIEGANPNADDEVAQWFRRLPRLAVECGAAVLLLDHATKSGDNDLWPIGSQRKRAAITGAAYLQKVAVPFGRDADGKAVLVCAKDRHGHYPLRRRVAALAVTGGLIDLASEGGGGAFRPTGWMERVSLLLEEAAEPLSVRKVRESLRGNKEHIETALQRLVSEGYVTVEQGARKAHLHTSVRPFRDAAEDEMDT